MLLIEITINLKKWIEIAIINTLMKISIKWNKMIETILIIWIHYYYYQNNLNTITITKVVWMLRVPKLQDICNKKKHANSVFEKLKECIV